MDKFTTKCKKCKRYFFISANNSSVKTICAYCNNIFYPYKENIHGPALEFDDGYEEYYYKKYIGHTNKNDEDYIEEKVKYLKIIEMMLIKEK